ncbi:MAG: hypothetical protein QF926_15165 [Alphaproteobacteria bacterium]|jgi:hypothetical protein|nr:hypothetical protein [Alphaproteobacteria bacterium]MDP6517944.1 hypothetical protein [Alphaproteobacteria bacterium]
MAHIQDLGRRIELLSMDGRFHDISIALYECRDRADRPAYRVHTYSGHDGADARIAWLTGAMGVLGGVEATGDDPHLLRFPCGARHGRACKQLFLEACKLDPQDPPAPRPLTIHDKKLDGTIRLESAGAGAYRVTAEGDGDRRDRRLAAVAGGLIKLAELDPSGDAEDQVAFPCGQPHDAMIGLLLVRALNVRSAIREREQAAARGVLAAPSAQSI